MSNIKYTDEQLIQVAKLIDNEFVGKTKTTVKHFHNSVSITTNEVDFASIIHITFDVTGDILAITRTGEDYTGNVLYPTCVRVNDYLNPPSDQTTTLLNALQGQRDILREEERIARLNKDIALAERLDTYASELNELLEGKV